MSIFCTADVANRIKEHKLECGEIACVLPKEYCVHDLDYVKVAELAQKIVRGLHATIEKE